MALLLESQDLALEGTHCAGQIIQDNIARGNKARIVVPIYDDYINWSIRFVAEKHPEWIEDKKSLQEIKVHPWLSQYYHVQPFEIYNANALSDNFNIWLKKNKIANIEAKKEKTKCASSELNGEYKVTWIIHNINGGYDPEIQGSEKLVIENCIGKFEGVKNFQPSAELRENLEVTLKSDGYLEIRGDLDLFEPGRSYFTSLEGNVSSGEIAGVWEEGDLIKIELIGLKELEKINSEIVKEIPIFEYEGETFNLKIDEIDYLILGPNGYTLERDKKYLHPWQLHKAVINSNLIKNKGQNRLTYAFNTLVYKQGDTSDQILVIHLDDPTLEPLRRHSDSLQKKCGLGEDADDVKLLSKWGWLSLITKTNNKEKAQNQQCHYDYFKESDDKKAWELFQAVLGGTNHILEFLETNVEL